MQFARLPPVNGRMTVMSAQRLMIKYDDSRRTVVEQPAKTYCQYSRLANTSGRAFEDLRGHCPRDFLEVAEGSYQRCGDELSPDFGG